MLIKCEYSVFWVVYSDNVSVAEFSTAIMIAALFHSESLWRRFRPEGSLLYRVGSNGEIVEKAAYVGAATALFAIGEDLETGGNGDVTGPVESRPTARRSTTIPLIPFVFTMLPH